MPDHPSLKLPPEKRDRLFVVSGAEFAANGFAQASLNRIISALGMSKSSFYHYFANKQDLFEQTLAQAMAPILAVQAAIDLQALNQENFWTEIGRMTDDMTQLANQSPVLVAGARMFYRSHDNLAERALTQPLMASMTHWIEQLLRRGQDLGLIRTDLPRSYLFDMVMALGMATDRWMLTHWEALSDQERLALNGKILEMFHAVLAPAAAT